MDSGFYPACGPGLASWVIERAEVPGPSDHQQQRALTLWKLPAWQAGPWGLWMDGEGQEQWAPSVYLITDIQHPVFIHFLKKEIQIS